MSYDCPRRDCPGFRTDDPAAMTAHVAAHGSTSAPVGARLRRQVALTVGWGTVLIPLAFVVGLVLLVLITGFED